MGRSTWWILAITIGLISAGPVSAETKSSLSEPRSTESGSATTGTTSRSTTANAKPASTTALSTTTGSVTTTVKPLTGTTTTTSTTAKPATSAIATTPAASPRSTASGTTSTTPSTMVKPATSAVTSTTSTTAKPVTPAVKTTGPSIPAPVKSGTTTTVPAAAAPASAAAAGGKQYDFGDYTSETLTTKAWEAQNNGDFAAVEAYAGKCIDMFEIQAEEQSQSLTDFAPKDKAFSYWALNDVATSHFILGLARVQQGRVKEAQQEFQTIIEKFPYAQCWDPKGWFWHVAEAANDKLSTLGTPYDFGDYTSSTLTVKGWGALGKNDIRGVELYTKKCFELYEAEAKKQQTSLTDFAPKDKAFDYWALNDVGTSYFILGESLMNQKKYPEAKAAFERVINDFGFAQCWDPKGWFWKVAQGSKDRVKKIQVLSQL